MYLIKQLVKSFRMKKKTKLLAMKYSTSRLIVAEDSKSNSGELFDEICSILSPEVTVSLPSGWSNINTREKANVWLEARKSEGTVLFVHHKELKRVVGFIFLYNMDNNSARTDYRFGYLLAQEVWGNGLGTELIKGLIDACKREGTINSVSGGVERNNGASIRVLEKIGFVSSKEDVPSKETLFFRYQF